MEPTLILLCLYLKMLDYLAYSHGEGAGAFGCIAHYSDIEAGIGIVVEAAAYTRLFAAVSPADDAPVHVGQYLDAEAVPPAEAELGAERGFDGGGEHFLQ